ncbi:hypothetical protein DPX16_11633 [Anabarilius grahami]|uniref:Uncharacterized protein n=1 Tax=Anabarilius grahami TaxID=495550 RepID=A0A3N0Z3Z0_ANAGA|nr:hypothetical protein DPX16_11633 [Anabarilius grahami]
MPRHYHRLRFFMNCTVETNAGNAAEDPGADAHAERGVLTPPSSPPAPSHYRGITLDPAECAVHFHPVEDRIHHVGMDGLLRNCATGCPVDEAFTMDDLVDSISADTSGLRCGHVQLRIVFITPERLRHSPYIAEAGPNAPAGLITEDIHTSPGPYSENQRHT